MSSRDMCTAWPLDFTGPFENRRNYISEGPIIYRVRANTDPNYGHGHSRLQCANVIPRQLFNYRGLIFPSTAVMLSNSLTSNGFLSGIKKSTFMTYMQSRGQFMFDTNVYVHVVYEYEL